MYHLAVYSPPPTTRSTEPLPLSSSAASISASASASVSASASASASASSTSTLASFESPEILSAPEHLRAAVVEMSSYSSTLLERSPVEDSSPDVMPDDPPQAVDLVHSSSEDAHEVDDSANADPDAAAAAGSLSERAEGSVVKFSTGHPDVGVWEGVIALFRDNPFPMQSVASSPPLTNSPSPTRLSSLNDTVSASSTATTTFCSSSSSSSSSSRPSAGSLPSTADSSPNSVRLRSPPPPSSPPPSAAGDGSPSLSSVVGTSRSGTSGTMTVDVVLAASEAVTLPLRRSTMLLILHVPSAFGSVDLAKWIGHHHTLITDVRIVRELSSGRHMALLCFRKQRFADRFYTERHLRPFLSLQPQNPCQLLFVADASFVVPDRQLFPPPPENQMQLPTCVVCLDRMDRTATGILTTVCDHSFHCHCLSKWKTDATCPVCRFCQHAEEDESCCQRCDETRDLWICVVCGHVGCGRYMDGHAFEHYLETQHNYVMQVDTQRVWDYAGDNYVHRLVQNRSDGKVVRLDTDDGAAGGKASDRKVNLLLAEYSSLLTAQLEAQRAFFEGELSKALARVQADSEERIDQLSKQITTLQQANELSQEAAQRSERDRRRLEQRVQQQQQRVAELEKENGFLREVNQSLQGNQSGWLERLAQAKAQYEADLLEKEAALEDLQEQVRDLSFFIEAGKAIEKAEDSDVAEGGVVKVKDTSPAKPAAFRKPRARRGRKR